MDKPTIGYFDKIWNALNDLPIRGEIIISEKVAPENRENFTDAVKFFIECDYGKKDGYYIEFTSDFLKVRKFSYPKTFYKAEENRAAIEAKAQLTII